MFGVDPLIAADDETPWGVPLMKRHLNEVIGEFDLIMFNHSLEHVPDPVATLKEAHEKLAAGGICLVRLPTTSSEAWTTYRADWFQIDAPRHIVIPSRQGMALAADMVGLRVEKTFDDSNSYQFIASEAYRRDISLTELKSYRSPARLFGTKRMWDWEKRADGSIGRVAVTRRDLSCGPNEEVGKLNRRLPVYAKAVFRQALSQACATHAAVGPACMVLYDVSTLHSVTIQAGRTPSPPPNLHPTTSPKPSPRSTAAMVRTA